MRKFLALLLPVMLFLSACSGANSGGTDTGDLDALKSVKVKETSEGAAPEVTFDAPLTVSQTTVRQMEAGDGEELKDGMTVDIQLVSLNPADGAVRGDTYSKAPESIALNEQLKTGNEVLYNALVGSKVGARLAYFVPGQLLGEDVEDQFYVFHLTDARTVPTRAEGEKVEPAAGLPAVTVDEATGATTIAKPEGTAPTELVVQDLIKGGGDEIQSGQTITVQYTGVKWSDGTVFDSSWTKGTPASFQIGTGGVIAGWDKGLVGKTVGSQVLLVIPPAEGYGANATSELKDETLVFVVDILETKSAE